MDTADSSVPGWSNKDRVGKDPVDDPSVTDTGAGPVTYADLGALELVDVPAPVDNPPVATLTASPATLTAGAAGGTTLDASRSTDDKGIAGYTFNCDNGKAAVVLTLTPPCDYPTAGNFKPSVAVKDTANQTTTASTTVTVTAVDNAPVAKLTADPGDADCRRAPPLSTPLAAPTTRASPATPSAATTDRPRSSGLTLTTAPAATPPPGTTSRQ